MKLRKGEIFKSNQTIHPIVFLELKNDYEFLGVILTHSTTEKFSENIEMNLLHFETYDELGEMHSVQYERTHFPKRHLIKKNDWGPFNKVGNLTSAGIKFLEEHLGELEPILWGEYVKE